MDPTAVFQARGGVPDQARAVRDGTFGRRSRFNPGANEA